MNNTPDNNTNIPAGSNKRSSPLLKVLPIAVLAAVLVYFAAQDTRKQQSTWHAWPVSIRQER